MKIHSRTHERLSFVINSAEARTPPGEPFGYS